MSTNPLLNIQNQARSAVVNWLNGGINWIPVGRRNGLKDDPVLAGEDMDLLRRVAYNNLFNIMFKDGQRYPIVAPDKTLKDVVGKLASNIYPTETSYTLPEKLKDNNTLLADIMERSGFHLQVSTLIEESAVMGYCGMRSIWLPLSQRWLLEIIPKERLLIESQDNLPEEITAICNFWSRSDGKKTFWRKERWTDKTYQIWPEVVERQEGIIPPFDDDKAVSSDNVYGEIPITLVPHVYKAADYGIGIIQREEFSAVKNLVTLRNKRFYAHIKYMSPPVVRKNHTNTSDPVNLDIDAVIDIASDNKDAPVDLALLEFQGIPETVKQEMIDWINSLWRAADLKPPPPDGENDSVGLPTSGVALRIIDKDDAKTITTLRKNGYSNAIKHYQKILRMGQRLGLTGYEFVNPDDALTYTITANFPDFFPPTDDDIAIQLANMKSAELPAMFQAKKIATLFGVEDEKDIQEIADNIQQSRDILNASIIGTDSNNFGGGSNGS